MGGRHAATTLSVFERERERFLAIPNNSNTHTSFGAWSPFTRARDVQTGLPGESEWRGSRLAQQRERCALQIGGT